MKGIAKYTILMAVIVFNLTTIAVANDVMKSPTSSLPVMKDAHIFANFTDTLPAVVNYYTEASKDQIIAFYFRHLGKPTSQESNQHYTTLLYQQKEEMIRVVISQQENQRQVDIIMK